MRKMSMFTGALILIRFGAWAMTATGVLTPQRAR
jgi:hypothetical protein